MKTYSFPFITVTCISTILFISCKRELSCEGCINGNKPPIANAGSDQTITLPKDSVLLDGSASSDPDGTITSYKWTKITGPASANIAKPDSTKTVVKSLAAGVYQFELTVIDNGGLSAKDTVQIMVNGPGNLPPVACAGADQTITLPTNLVTLDGSCSADPDNNITIYAWTKVSGPSAFAIVNANAVQTQVTGLVQGVYLFELKVTDAGGLINWDTIEVKVNPAVVTAACDNSNRPIVNGQLIPAGALSQARFWMGVASAANKIVFAGGFTDFFLRPTALADIYDANTQTWSTANLSAARAGISTVSTSNKIFFAGGYYYDPSDKTYDNPISINVMDVYDVSSNSWSVVTLPGNRTYSSSAATENKIFLVEGNKVDIYDIATGTWSSKTFSDGRFDPAVVATNVKVYFAGGTIWQNFPFSGGPAPVNTIDIYDINSQTWTVSSLSQAKALQGWTGIAGEGKAYFAGGYTTPNLNYPPSGGQTFSCTMDIIDANTSVQKVSYLSRQWPGPGKMVIKNNSIAFLIGDPRGQNNTDFDIYNLLTDTWSIGRLELSQNVILWGASILSVNNTVYVAGTYHNMIKPSEILYKLEF